MRKSFNAWTRVLALCAGSLIMASLWGATPAQATTVLALDLPDLIERSHLILRGRVLDTQSALIKTPGQAGQAGVQVRTRVVLTVDEVLAGEHKSPRLSLDLIGGTVGEKRQRITQKIHGAPEFAVGESVLLFLERADTGRLVVTGMSQGKYTLSTDAQGVMQAVQDSEPVHLRSLRTHTVRRFAGVPRDARRFPLARLRALLAGEKPQALQPTPAQITPTTPQVVMPPASAKPVSVQPAVEGGDR